MSTLFHHVLKEDGATLTEQVYSAILGEIHNQHWREGEKLPSYSELVGMSGVSRSIFQSAFRRLEQEGFVTAIKHKGVFVKEKAHSRHPVVGRIAVILQSASETSYSPASGITDTFGFLDLHHLKTAASKQGYVISLHQVNEKGDVSPDLEASPDKTLKGIISMVPASCLSNLIGADGSSAAPIVYLGVADDFSCPRVAADILQATQVLTRHLIDLGHRKIALLSGPDWNEKLLEKAWQGYVQALASIGQEPDANLLSFLREKEPMDARRLKGFLGAFADCTAVVCTTYPLAQKLVEVCDLLEIRIPEDLSIVSLQVAVLRPSLGAASPAFTGVVYSWDELFLACFESFAANGRNRRVSSVNFMPELWLEKSTAPPRE